MEAVHVVGAGGIGCAIGFTFRAAGWPLTMIERSPSKIEWRRQHGIRVDQRLAVPNCERLIMFRHE
jgi:2-dehydropantoate 2-reductase